jgi:hypothetical protein
MILCLGSIVHYDCYIIYSIVCFILMQCLTLALWQSYLSFNVYVLYISHMVRFMFHIPRLCVTLH